MRRARALIGIAALALAGGGAIAQDLPARCTDLTRADAAGRFVAMLDLARPESPLDGDDLLAVVDRSPEGALAPDYRPDDLVDLTTMRPARASQCTPPARQCLRREAAHAYRELARAMRDAGHVPHVTSAFRDYRVQCSTFQRWVSRGGFCEAAQASALPGHSQHQLGTTLDLFTYAWTLGGDKFRPGFGCSEGGRWLAEHAESFGFVVPYPLHPDHRVAGSTCAAIDGDEARLDPRTGYRYEPWHLRYVGRETVARFRAAREASGPDTAAEITLDQFLRAHRGAARPVGVPVCDGCNCDRCATYAPDGPCAPPAWRLDASGHLPAPAHAPRLRSAALSRRGPELVLEARIEVAPNTATHGPIVTERSGAWYARGAREVRLASGTSRAFPAIDGAHRLAIGFGDRGDWPWHAALVGPDRDGAENGFDAPIPAAPGVLVVRVPMRGVRAGTEVRVGIAHAHDPVALAWTGAAP
ncbi:MAG: M15 family metallopeptidase [Sandaracinaceae bacterium]|nr:M15 family metallopeptidase [Sandaracinaceae bacterium]